MTDFSLKIVTKLPIEKLWNENNYIDSTREKNLTKNELINIIKKSPLKFVIADIGHKLKWIPLDKCYKFWKLEIKDNLIKIYDKIELESFPSDYAYLASKWTAQN